MSAMIKVLFVCLGNICRSPAAEVALRALVARRGLDGRVGVDSAATSSMQVGRPPDPRAQAVGKRRGLDLAGLRARQIRQTDFDRFDHILAMDRANLADLRTVCPSGRADRLGLFLDRAGYAGDCEVPDPYFERGLESFERMFALIETGSDRLLNWLRRRHPEAFAAPAPVAGNGQT
jgi:protein-tyrosine phosphatase